MTTRELQATDEADNIVPEFPALASNVELCGQLQGSGFAAEQWLIQRDGRFLQVTRVLYHMAEAATGNRSIDEIAESVTAATGRMVSPAQVRHLLRRQLIPAGIVAPATQADELGARLAAPSALAVNMRVGVIGPRRIEPVTRFLRYFYWPPVVLMLLTAAVAGHIWLYFGHGAGASVQGALTAPGALLAALGIFIVSACFHELGHAAALHYAGGRVRGMGIGMYLVYPVFYTDVTDSYRFGRWARVRTDLGGFYFNVIFALGLMGLYAVTGAEFLLLVVVMTNFDILRQSLPFVRMDGYWVLADLTGIPDLFTHLPAFVKSRIPFRRSAAPATQFRLKGWVAACFALYVLVTVPLLLAALFFMVRSVPQVVAGALTSFRAFGELFWAALQAKEFLIAAATAAQVGILGLTVLGLVYVLGRVAFDVGRGLWRWGRPSAERRAIATLAGTAMAAAVVALWLPQLPRFGGPADNIAARAAMPPMFDALSDADIHNGSERQRSGDQEVLVADRSAPASSAAGPSSSLVTFRFETPTELVKTHESAVPPIATDTAEQGVPTATDVSPSNPASVVAPVRNPTVLPTSTSSAGTGGEPGNVGPGFTNVTAAAAPSATSVAETEPPVHDAAVVAPTVDATVPASTPALGASAGVNLPGASATVTDPVPTFGASAGAAFEAPAAGPTKADASITIEPNTSTAKADATETSTSDAADLLGDSLPNEGTEGTVSTTVEPVVDTVASTADTVEEPVSGLLQ